nr:methyltransferase [Pontibaca salina]
MAGVQVKFYPLGLSFGGHWADFVGGILIGGGILLILLAVSEFRRHRTTIMPHRTPETLIQSGIFSRTRNPVYLGDVMVLAGLIIVFDAVLSLPLIPLFVWVLERRFVLPEEDRMRREFRLDWARYAHKTRRWL